MRFRKQMRRVAWFLAALLLFAGVVSAQEQHRTIFSKGRPAPGCRFVEYPTEGLRDAGVGLWECPTGKSATVSVQRLSQKEPKAKKEVTRTFHVPTVRTNNPVEPEPIRHIFVDCTLNGRPARLLLDTGSHITVVRSSLPNGPSVWLGIGPVNHQAPVFPVTLAPADVAHIVDMDGVKIDGVLGNDVLSHFKSVKMDYESGWMELEEYPR